MKDHIFKEMAIELRLLNYDISIAAIQTYCDGDRINLGNIMEHGPKGVHSEWPMSSLSYFKQIYISNKELEKLPPTIGELKNLTKLLLPHNNLTSLPESIGDLSNLEELWLDFNNISSLPDSIGNLVSLEYLGIQFNKLEHLPESIGHLQKLKWLYLSFNELKTLPETIGKLEQLEEFSVHTNPIKSLPRFDPSINENQNTMHTKNTDFFNKHGVENWIDLVDY